MDNNFTKKLLVDLVHKTLFNEIAINDTKLYFSKDFISSHSSYLNGNSTHNQLLALNTVQRLLELGQEDRNDFREFVLDNLLILKKITMSHTKGIKHTNKKITEYLDLLLYRLNNDEIVEGILIEFICHKLQNLDTISFREINQGFITKELFDEFTSYIC